MKVAYCGYDFFSACLTALIDAGYDVASVYTMPCDNRFNYNQYIYEIAERNALSVSEAPVDNSTIKQLDTDGVEVLITAAYPYKIPELSGTSIRGINIHPTLLPRGRGVWPLPWIILNGDARSGVTIHAITQSYDAGDVLAQKDFSLTQNENLESLSAKSQMLARDMLLRVMANFDAHWQRKKAQAELGEASYWPQPAKRDRRIDWASSVELIDRKVRAFGKAGSFAAFDNRDWIIYVLNAWKCDHHFSPGEVVHKTNTEMIIAAGDGLVSLLYFQPAP